MSGDTPSYKAQPPWLDKVQFILFMAFNPCDEEFGLYVEMAKKPFGKLALMLLTPDLTQIVQGFFTPKGLRSKRHGRKGRKGGKGGKGGIPDVDEMFAKNLPGQGDYANRSYGSGQRFFFSGLQALDRVSWPLVLIDEVTDTAFETMSGVMNASKEGCPNLGRMLRKASGGNVLSLLGWHADPANTLKYAVRVTTTSGNTAFLPEGEWSITIAQHWENRGTQTADAQVRIVYPGGSPGVLDTSSKITLAPDAEGDTIASTRFTGPGVIAWEHRAFDHSLWRSYADVFILQIDGGVI